MPAATALARSSAYRPEVSVAAGPAVSAPVRGMAPSAPTARRLTERPLRPLGSDGVIRPDGALQSSVSGPAVATTAGLNFAGVGNGDYGFAPDAAPPDTNGAVGATQYVQWVNESFAVFDKATGGIVSGPTRGNQLFANLGGACASNNDGDPIAQYDKANHRWILTQF